MTLALPLKKKRGRGANCEALTFRIARVNLAEMILNCQGYIQFWGMYYFILVSQSSNASRSLGEIPVWW